MIGWLLALAPALGSTFVDVPTVEALVRDSSTVVVGSVTIANTEPCSLGLCTTYTIAVSQTWRGEDRSTVRVTLPGGRTGGLTQRVAGLPLWDRGDEVVLFLDDEGIPGWTSLFTIQESRDPRALLRIADREVADPVGRRHLTSVQELREQVFRAESTRL